MLFTSNIDQMPNHILFLLTQDLQSPSGLGRYLPLATELAHKGFDVKIMALHSNFNNLVDRKMNVEGVLIEYVGPMHVKKTGSTKTYYPLIKLLLLMLRATWQLTRATFRYPADIVYVCKPHPMNSLAALVGKLFRVSRQIYLDCDDYEVASNRFSGEWQRQVIALFENGMPSRADIVTYNTRFTMERLRSLGVPEERLIYLPNGVDRIRFAPSPAEQLEKLRDTLGLRGRQVIVYVGSLSMPSHPVDLLLRAFPRVKAQFPKASLLIVGGGEELAALKAMADAMDLQDSIYFTGKIPASEAPLYFRLGTVSIDPVHNDLVAVGRAPLKMVESWASGVPFVTADVGDRRWLAGDPPAALLAQSDSEESLADALTQVLGNIDLAQSLRERGLRRVEAYNWDQIIERVAWVFQPRDPHP